MSNHDVENPEDQIIGPVNGTTSDHILIGLAIR